MRSTRLRMGVAAGIVLATLLSGSWRPAGAQSPRAQTAGSKETGYAVKKPVFGGACPTCPWGAMAEVVKAAMKFYGWDVQICYYCAGGERAARLVAAAAMATPPANTTANPLPTPNGPLDFGATGAEFLTWAYRGSHEFAKDPGAPQKQLRLIANIQEPTYYIVAVRADSGITDLRQITEKRMPVKMIATGIGGPVTAGVLEYYGLNKEKVEALGGTFSGAYARDKDADVIMGLGSLVNAPEYNIWYQATQKYDLKYLELPPDLRQKLVQQFDLSEGKMPLGLFRGVDKAIPTVIRNGTVVYGRTDMPDDFAYTLAKAMDEHKDLLEWTHMNWSYNEKFVWKAFDVPLHPGAARYYKERGYMK